MDGDSCEVEAAARFRSVWQRTSRIRLKFVVQGGLLPVGRLINQNQLGPRRGAGLNRDRPLALSYGNVEQPSHVPIESMSKAGRLIGNLECKKRPNLAAV